MAKLLGAHWPHLIFVALGVAVFLWTAYRPEREGRRESAPEPAGDRPAKAPATVRPSVARRGLLALGPLLGAMATGAILYGLDLGASPVPQGAIWAHSGISLLAVLLVAYKVADLGAARIRRAFTRQRLPELASIILGAVSVPLLLTGVGLWFAPSTQSYLAYSHLISSAWWTGLLLWHLRRYLGLSLGTLAARRTAAGTPAR